MCFERTVTVCAPPPSPPPQYVIRAPSAGVVDKVMYKVGDNVAKNALLVHMQAEEGEKDDAGGSEDD